MLKHLKKYSHVYMTALIVMFFVCLITFLTCREAGLSLRLEKASPAPQAAILAPQALPAGWSVKEPSQAAEFISGPVAASVGELCVFRLSDAKTYADWCIVPEATCYIDSSGSSLAFASNNRATYTILAAIVEDGIPKILTHVCEYGLGPQPEPSPTPNPDPTPKPNPPPNLSIQDWVRQNIPDGGKHQAAALASCYDATADAIENGSILTQSAAYSTIRTASQTKIEVGIWSEFLETLSSKVTAALDGNTDAKKLGSIFREIATGLKAVADVPDEGITEPEGNVAVPSQSPSASIIQAPVGRLSVQNVRRPAEAPDRDPTARWCPDPTGQACQPQPTTPNKRRAR